MDNNEALKAELVEELLARLRAMQNGAVDEEAFERLYKLKLEEDKLDMARAESAAAARDKQIDRGVGAGMRFAELGLIGALANIVLKFEETGSVRSLIGRQLFGAIFKKVK